MKLLVLSRKKNPSPLKKETSFHKKAVGF